jgi:hypothetical protein
VNHPGGWRGTSPGQRLLYKASSPGLTKGREAGNWPTSHWGSDRLSQGYGAVDQATGHLVPVAELKPEEARQ